MTDGGGRSRSGHILLILALTNLVAYAARNALFTVYPQLTARFGIDDAEIGLLQTVFMLSHALATLPFGWAGDAYDRRKVIALGVTLASVAGAAGAIGSSYVGLAATRALVGFGTAAVVPVATSILAELFDGPHKASRMSIFNLGLFLGGVIGFGTGVAVGFPLVVIVLAAPGFLLAGLILRLPLPPRTQTTPQVVWWRYLGPFLGRFRGEARELLRIKTLRWLLVSATTMAFAAGGYNAWLKELLVRSKGMSEAQATTLLMMCLGTGLSGILLGGKLADVVRRRSPAGRMWTMVASMALTVPCAALAIVVPNGASLYVAGMATMFFISAYHAPMAATIDDLAPDGRRVAAQGLVIFTMHMIGTAPSSWVVGVISDQAGLERAMWVPTAALVVAAAAMAVATRSFATDRVRHASEPLPGSSGSDLLRSL